MKQAFRLSCALVAFILCCGAPALAQSTSPTPDPFITQVTSSAGESFANDISGNGRFVVIESSSNIATHNPNNADGNREIFLFDYAQRRIFQITNTTSARNNQANPITDLSNIKVEVSNNRPVITYEPGLVNGRRVYSIVFSSNAVFNTDPANPSLFNGDANSAALADDGNQEVWIYQLPPVADASLSSNESAPLVDLTTGTFTRVTSTPASRKPIAASGSGSNITPPFVADDNRDATINDNGTIIAFVSTRDIATDRTPGATGRNNEDANPEIFIFDRTTTPGRYIQLTSSRGTLVFNENPSLSGSGARVAFISNANLAGSNNDDKQGNCNAEVFAASPTDVASIRQITNTKAPGPGFVINILAPGRRLSRDGSMLAFESVADLEGSGAIQSFSTSFIYRFADNSFTQVGPRATSGGDVERFPTFTGDGSRLVFASALNFNPDGSAPASGSGLNPNNRVQIFSANVTRPVTFRRLTNMPAPNDGTAAPQPLASNTEQRIAFSLARTELGGQNTDNSTEVFYLLSPSTARGETTATLRFFTGATEREVSATATPAVAGVAPGMLVIMRSESSVTLADASGQPTNPNDASEDGRRPSLPVELRGVSVAVGPSGAAAGLYFVGPNQINFVVPPGITPPTGTPNTLDIVINNNGAVIRSKIPLTPVQPDIPSTTNSSGGRVLRVMNVTNPGAPMPEPPNGFPLTSPNNAGTLVPTVLEIILTGIRAAQINQSAQVRVTIGTIDITVPAARITRSGTAGYDQINVELPATLPKGEDVPVVVSVTIGGQTFTSRPAAEAPKLKFQ